MKEAVARKEGGRGRILVASALAISVLVSAAFVLTTAAAAVEVAAAETGVGVVVAAETGGGGTAATVSIGEGLVNVSETIVVPLVIKGATEVAAVEVNLTFDESVVTVVNCTNSSFEIPPQDPPYDRGPGWVRINAGQVVKPPLNGDVKICDVTFKAVGRGGGKSPLHLTEVKLENMQMQGLRIKTVNDGKLKIRGGSAWGIPALGLSGVGSSLAAEGLVVAVFVLCLKVVGLRRKRKR
ncbi:MAG: cohesin domain-containing protein [Methanophagales archaeon]|nr:cohesin domain-containing protein [Methanophagales archaeon]